MAFLEVKVETVYKKGGIVWGYKVSNIAGEAGFNSRYKELVEGYIRGIFIQSGIGYVFFSEIHDDTQIVIALTDTHGLPEIEDDAAIITF